jgi:murein L,D-transpeptidase YafK
MQIGRNWIKPFSRPHNITRQIFGLFGKKKEQPLPTIFKETDKNEQKHTSFKEQLKPKEDEAFLRRRDEFMMEFEARRNKQDHEIEARRRDIEFAETRAKREYEVTVANLDYKKMIVDNLQLDAQTDFESYNEILAFINQVTNMKVGSE